MTDPTQETWKTKSCITPTLISIHNGDRVVAYVCVETPTFKEDQKRLELILMAPELAREKGIKL